MSTSEEVFTERRGMRFVGPVVVGSGALAGIVRLLVGGSPGTGSIVAMVFMGLVLVACVVSVVLLARQGRISIVVAPHEIRVAAVRYPARFDAADGRRLLLRLAGTQPIRWELMSAHQERAISLAGFDPKAVAEAARRAGWEVIEVPVNRGRAAR